MFPRASNMIRPGDPPCPPAPPDPPLQKPADWAEPANFPTQREVNQHNDWVKNTKIKTGKCDICSERVKVYSWECVECRKRICSECAEYDYGSSQPQYRFIARDNLLYKCGCYYADTGGQAPYILRQMESLRIVRPPPWRGAEDMRNRQIKADIKERKRKREEAIARGENPEAEIAALKAAQEARLSAFGGDVKAVKPKRGRPPGTTKKKKLTPYHHLQNGTTVIVGAGIIGMCLAYELATKLKEAKLQHTVVVLDLEHCQCKLTSANCTGLITARGLPEEMGTLVELAKQTWQELLQTPGFEKETCFNIDKVFTTYKEDGRRAAAYPCWFVPDDEIFLDEEDSMATIDTMLFGQWLHDRCIAMGVQFYFHSRLTSVSKVPSANDVSSVEICTKTNNQEDTVTRISCSNLVLACGPWTTKLFSSIFRKSPLQLNNHVRKAYHYRVTYSHMPESGSSGVGIFLPDLAAEHDRLAPEVFLAGRPWRPHAAIGLVEKTPTNRPCLRAEVTAPYTEEERQTIEIVGRMAEAKLVHSHHHNSHDLGLSVANTASGMSLISAAITTTTNNNGEKDHGNNTNTRGGLPIIDKVPTSTLGRIPESDEEDKRKCGVWLCYGFGMHGTTLGPAAARVLVRKMMGVESQVEEQWFAIPGYVKPVRVAAEAERKKVVGKEEVREKTEREKEEGEGVMEGEKEKAEGATETKAEKEIKKGNSTMELEQGKEKGESTAQMGKVGDVARDREGK